MNKAQATRLKWLRAVTIVTALLLIAAGIWRGETAVILKKAVKVCLECIGVG